ncbi:unnamed protein product [Didymodactylos carnosus]|uniref:Uncharacterized protein n=1 Tax=Didymodactylos carnosus TaxID=1234261 RepID=A0A8S2TAZ9_9BILA|nr:unnamed protein product [Didymodactylos carnosus]CAF4249116.1 unnamed protein product [Didymodactylos carnosus]
MRQSSSVVYLLCATIFQLLAIIFCVSTRVAALQYGSTLDSRSAVYCKLRYYLGVALPALASYYMFLAIMDRCFATSENAGLRAWAQPKVACRLAAGIS